MRRRSLALTSTLLLLATPSYALTDADADGFDSTVDCNDNDASIYPGALEICNGVDDNCDTVVDEGLSWDLDGDGFTTPGSCAGSQDDCADQAASVFPGATELCNGVDDNCDGAADEGLWVDGDQDGFPAAPACGALRVDCDDLLPSVNPDQNEILGNAVDDNCNGWIDEDPLGNDEDGDGYCAGIDLNADGLAQECTDLALAGDCNDTNPNTHPGAIEWSNDGVDNNCDGQIDEAAADIDGDGFAADQDCNDWDPSVYPGAPEMCNGLDDDCDGLLPYLEIDGDQDGWTPCEGDCNDASAAQSPGNLEVCADGLDNNCDSWVDLDFDLDGDGYSSCGGDCNEFDDTIHPGAPELCDGIDQDCDGDLDNGFDLDGDGWTLCNGDCDDLDAWTHPGAVEICGDGIDQDCDGQVDDDADDDGDGWTQCGGDCDDDPGDANGDGLADGASISPSAGEQCNGLDDDCDGLVDEGFDGDGDGWLLCQGDCDDGDDQISPDAVELCDALDNNCNGQMDEGVSVDADADGVTDCQGDCDDFDADTYPGANEACDGKDNDCDGALAGSEVDDDGDGYDECRNGDCDDTNAEIYPSAEELCDTLDNDCNGQVDDTGDSDGDGATLCDGDCDDENAQVGPQATEFCGDGLDNDCDGGIDDDDAEGCSKGGPNGSTGCGGCNGGRSAAPGAPTLLLLLLPLLLRRRRLLSFYRSGSQLLLPLLFVGILSCTSDSSAQAEAQEKAKAASLPGDGSAQQEPGNFLGKVVETLDGGGYTYARVKGEGGEQWFAGPQASLQLGQELSLSLSMEMRDFEARSLGKTFERIFFLGGWGAGPGAGPHGQQVAGAPNGGGGSEPANPHAGVEGAPPMGPANPPSSGKIQGIKKAKGGYTVAQIYAKAASLAGKPVVVRGQVVKFSAGIMGKNWIHLQDGSGAEGSKDLVITTDATAAKGELVLIEGKLVVDQDFGYGYTYPVLLEQAKVTSEQ